MRYLLPIGWQFDRRFRGILTSYKHRGIPAGIKAGHAWANYQANRHNYRSQFALPIGN